MGVKEATNWGTEMSVYSINPQETKPSTETARECKTIQRPRASCLRAVGSAAYRPSHSAKVQMFLSILFLKSLTLFFIIGFYFLVT